jgi:NAD(P)-dependent dehydrogenase (short-subunit alcohol dehydrogenase family)
MNIAILGAGSGMAVEIGRIYAARGDALFLLDIKADDLEAIRDDLLVRGAAKAEAMVLDLAAPPSYDATLQEIAAKLGGIDALVIAYGILGDQARAKDDLSHARAILDTDFTSAALWMLAAAKVVKPSGVIAVFSSVAGDRGRQSNFIYGAAKGGLALVAQGLAHDLAATGPHVLAIKPGTVITPMTAGMVRRGPLWADAKTIARIVVNAIDKKRGPIVYAPWFWRWIMLIIRLIPAPVFHKTKL